MNENLRYRSATSKRLDSRALFAPLLTAMLYCGSLVMAHAQTNYQRLKSFGFPELSGSNPRSPLVKGSDGKFYGTTFAGGTKDAGTAFKLNSDGSDYAILHHFTGDASDGSGPVALIEGSDGALYGTTVQGGTRFCSGGTIFRVNKNGSGYAVLRSFDGCGDAIDHPPLSVIQGSDGALYGTTSTGGVPGGTNSIGAVFRLNQDGGGYVVLNLFTNSNDGYDPANVIQGHDGALYGTAWSGGSNNAGTIFKLNPDGSSFTVLHSFSGGDSDGSDPRAGLLEGSDSALYGTTIHGGTNDYGTIFKLNKDGNGFIILRSFPWVEDGWPIAALMEGSDGMLYGSTKGYKRFGGLVFKLNKDGNGYTVLHSYYHYFGDGPSEGDAGDDPSEGGPPNGLVEGNDGALYGTTQSGGGNGEGTVFKLTRNGNGYTALYSFDTAGGDGSSPGRLVHGSDGALYGTTFYGGSAGVGTVFKLNKDGSSYIILRSFNTNGIEGQGPIALLEGNDGVLYGTTDDGGSSGAGVVFKLNKDGSAYSVLRSFSTNDVDGRYPRALIEGSDGVLYGTTGDSGSSGSGTVFKLNKDGGAYSVLRSFSVDGRYPWALIEGSDGVLYGTTADGSSSGAGTVSGTVFKLNKDGSAYSVLRSFGANGIDGTLPTTALLEGSDGVLYGTTSLGGSNALGTVFKLNKDGSAYSVLRSFSNGIEGQLPWALLEGSDGVLYGTTEIGGGAGSIGTVFKFNKDGSAYCVLHSFNSSSGDGAYPFGLVQGSEGALYGTTDTGGGRLGLGTVFKLFSSTLSIAFTQIEFDGARARLSFSGGAAGQTFRIETKTDLCSPLWQAIATNWFGIDGKFQFLDTGPSNYPSRFYRSATP